MRMTMEAAWYKMDMFVGTFVVIFECSNYFNWYIVQFIMDNNFIRTHWLLAIALLHICETQWLHILKTFIYSRHVNQVCLCFLRCPFSPYDFKQFPIQCKTFPNICEQFAYKRIKMECLMCFKVYRMNRIYLRINVCIYCVYFYGVRETFHVKENKEEKLNVFVDRLIRDTNYVHWLCLQSEMGVEREREREIKRLGTFYCISPIVSENVHGFFYCQINDI